MTYLKWLQELNRFKIEIWHKSLKENPGQGEDRNYPYDRERALEQLIGRLNHRWETRDWTGAEWNTHSLMTINID